VIFDINAFVGKWPYWPVRSSSVEEVEAELRAWGIDGAAICSTRSLFVNYEDGNLEAEAAVAQAQGDLVAFACLGTRELSHQIAAAGHDFESYRERGFAGVRLYPQHHSYHPLYEAWVEETLEDAAQWGWPVMLPLRVIMNWGMPMLDLGVMEALVTRHPKVNWILAGVNYLHELQLAVSLMRRFESVYLETSCIAGYEAVAKTAQQVGAARLLFGSGAAIQHGAAALSKILHAGMPDAQKELIAGGNARRLLRLDTE
jgi:predicted TIM-barrel fold metal-dependent hydrolase